MNDNHSTKMKMYMNVINICTRNQNSWSAIPAFQNSFNSFTAQVNRINELNKQLQNTSKATTEAKNRQKQLMCDTTMVLVGAIKAYVNITKNTELLGVAGTTPSAILKAKDVDADDICMFIAERAQSILPQLADFGVTGAEMDAAIQAINGFAWMVGKPKQEILVNKSNNEQLAALIKKADNILNEELDGLMLRFKTTSEIFYNEYHSAKRIGGATPKKEEPEV